MSTATAARDLFAVGEVLVCSWGYDQTNVDWYVVTLRTRSTVQLARIAGTRSGDGLSPMAGYALPEMPPRIVGEERITRRVNAAGSVRLESYAWARPWDGRQRYCSWYA